MLHRSRGTLNDAKENVSRGMMELGKDPHYQADFRVNLCKMILSEFTWGNSGSITPGILCFTCQRAGKRKSPAVLCVPAAISEVKWPAQTGARSF